MSFEDYMKLKDNPPPCYFTKKAIHQYEMWLDNISSRIQHIRQKQLRGVEHVQSNVNTAPSLINKFWNKPHSLTPLPLPPKPFTLMQRSASAPKIKNLWTINLTFLAELVWVTLPKHILIPYKKMQKRKWI